MNFVASFAALVIGAFGQGQETPPSVLPDVVVRAERPDSRQLERFVDDLAAPPFGVTSLARWDEPLCVEVDNLAPAAAAVLQGRVEARATSVGVTVSADPSCRPNVIIIPTADARATARSLVAASPRAFRIANEMTQLDRRALGHFQESEQPVRWWAVSLPIDATTRQAMVAPIGSSGPVQRNLSAAQQFGGNIRNVLRSVVIVLDATQTGSVPIETLADYIAFVALAQVEAPERALPLETILNLFQGEASSVGWSAWDHAYLSALYDTKVVWQTVAQHRAEIARRMQGVVSMNADGP